LRRTRREEEEEEKEEKEEGRCIQRIAMMRWTLDAGGGAGTRHT
jgi:hypothetical protein